LNFDIWSFTFDSGDNLLRRQVRTNLSEGKGAPKGETPPDWWPERRLAAMSNAWTV